MIMDDNVTVLSMNVRGLFSNSKKRADVFDWAKSKHASIVIKYLCLKKSILFAI
jgi:hypothetical protein